MARAFRDSHRSSRSSLGVRNRDLITFSQASRAACGVVALCCDLRASRCTACPSSAIFTAFASSTVARRAASWLARSICSRKAQQKRIRNVSDQSLLRDRKLCSYANSGGTGGIKEHFGQYGNGLAPYLCLCCLPGLSRRAAACCRVVACVAACFACPTSRVSAFICPVAGGRVETARPFRPWPPATPTLPGLTNGHFVPLPFSRAASPALLQDGLVVQERAGLVPSDRE